MAISTENFAARHMVATYFECKRNGGYPYPGTWGAQTAFTVALFDYLDEIVAETQLKNAQEQANKNK